MWEKYQHYSSSGNIAHRISADDGIFTLLNKGQIRVVMFMIFVEIYLKN